MTSDTDSQLDDVLSALMRHMTVAVSGEKLARELGVSHSRVARSVERLRSEGIEILGEPFSGFRLTRLPDVLLPELIRNRLHTRDMGRPLHHLYSVDSTNAFAERLLARAKPPRHGTVVVAERQTEGKGRLGRSWVSLRSTGLYLTLILRPRISSNLAPLLTLGAAVAVHEAVERISGLDVDIKWPNDLLVGNRKLGGILSELYAELDRVSTMVIGVGVNVNHTRMPDELSDIGTSMKMESGREHSRIEILLDFLMAFERLYDRFLDKGPSAIIEPWTSSSSFAEGRMLEVNDGVRRIRGVTRGLNALGALRIDLGEGQVEEVYSGDVTDWR